MSRPSPSNVPGSPLRWTAVRAAEEFDVDQLTLRKALTNAQIRGITEASCTTYSTKEIIAAIFDDTRALKDKILKEQGINWALKNETLRGNLLDRGEVTKALEISFKAIAQIVRASSLGKKDQDDILLQLSEIPSVLSNVAKSHAIKESKKAKSDTEDGGGSASPS